jgi:hypothetical protein
MADPPVPATDQVPLFDFMVVRAPAAVDPAAARRNFINNSSLSMEKDVVTEPEVEIWAGSSSAVTALIYRKVFCTDPLPEDPMADLLTGLLTLVPGRPLSCAGGVATHGETPGTVRLDELERHAWIQRGDLYHVLFDSLDQLAHVPLAGRLPAVLAAIDEVVAGTGQFDGRRLRERIEGLYDRKPLSAVVFRAAGHTTEFLLAKRALFEALYLGYVLQRWTDVELGEIIDGLQALHVMEALALDHLHERARAGATDDTVRMFLALGHAYPGLRGWDRKAAAPGFPLVNDRAALVAYRTAMPIVHPMFARLFYHLKPFNDIRPVGVGDLKVVKQWLTAYRPGEISHVHNVMKGEDRTRDHRRLERSEESFSLTTERAEDVTSESQSTERFEVKKETENVVSTMLNVHANANMTYNNSLAMITASAGGGFSYSTNSEDHTRVAQNFARDVVSKAVERVESRTVQQRSTVLTFETEEKNLQKFLNDGDEHISGMYRWIDKVYTAQVFNYGERLMFEFLVPEPAAFWVESRIQAYVHQVEVPQPPFPEPERGTATLPFTWDKITPEMFGALKIQYDLKDLDYPVRNRTVPVRNKQTRDRTFKEVGINKENVTRAFDCEIADAAGYEITEVNIVGHIEFAAKNPVNSYRLTLNDKVVYTDPAAKAGGHPAPGWVTAEDGPIALTGTDAAMTLSFTGSLEDYDLLISVRLVLPGASLEQFQRSVHALILSILQRRLDERYLEEKQAFDAKMSEYTNRKAQLRAIAVRDLVTGESEAANRLVINEEIKKHCLTMIAKEFDSDTSQDVLGKLDGMTERGVCAEFRHMEIKEKAGERTTIGYPIREYLTDYPSIELAVARKKATLVQFLEQAFEWDRISYLFYPYFWAQEKKWVELMHRRDDADPTFSAFLRAGMARVLVAVRPGYERAVPHYLGSRQPWGFRGAQPVIGQRLFVALHEEIRRQQDDRTGGRPEGEPWTYTVPTSLVYLHGSETPLPDLAAERAEQP